MTIRNCQSKHGGVQSGFFMTRHCLASSKRQTNFKISRDLYGPPLWAHQTDALGIPEKEKRESTGKRPATTRSGDISLPWKRRSQPELGRPYFLRSVATGSRDALIWSLSHQISVSGCQGRIYSITSPPPSLAFCFWGASLLFYE